MARLIDFMIRFFFPLPKNKKGKTRYGHQNPGKGGQTSVGKGCVVVPRTLAAPPLADGKKRWSSRVLLGWWTRKNADRSVAQIERYPCSCTKSRVLTFLNFLAVVVMRLIASLNRCLPQRSDLELHCLLKLHPAQLGKLWDAGDILHMR